MMKESPMLISESLPEINYYARTITYGREFDMVKFSLEHIVDIFPPQGTNKHAIFIEPLIETGYPDIVIIEYSPEYYFNWSELRNRLTNNDLRVLFEIMQHKVISVFKLEGLLGYKPRDLIKSIESLKEAAVVIDNDGVLSSCFKPTNINRIIAIEAKIDKWSAAIDQAFLNTRFATESYVMMNKMNVSSKLHDRLDDYGIGVISVDEKVRRTKAAKKIKYPASYTSLLFNEWIGRYIDSNTKVSADAAARVV